MGLTNKDFVAFLKGMVGQPYWYGTCVYKCTSSVLNSKTRQYPSHYTSSRMSKYKDAIAKKCVSADCVGLGKGFVWTNGGQGVLEAIGTDKTFSSKYGSNGCPDQSANGMFSWAKSHGKKYGKINTIPEVPGIAVRYDGHVGYYIGDGKVIEARGFNYGIVITKLSSRNWLDWYEFPGIIYGEIAPSKPEPEPELGSRILAKGAKGNDVKQLQVMLMELGYKLPKYGADGDFGSETETAIKKFQKDNNLLQTGKADMDTFEQLLNDHGSDDPIDAKPEKPIDVSKYPTLRRNDKGDFVALLQTNLNALGYSLGSCGVDGDFGSKTLTAVKAFQRQAQIKVDGIVGKNTWTQLLLANS